MAYLPTIAGKKLNHRARVTALQRLIPASFPNRGRKYTRKSILQKGTLRPNPAGTFHHLLPNSTSLNAHC